MTKDYMFLTDEELGEAMLQLLQVTIERLEKQDVPTEVILYSIIRHVANGEAPEAACLLTLEELEEEDE